MGSKLKPAKLNILIKKYTPEQSESINIYERKHTINNKIKVNSYVCQNHQNKHQLFCPLLYNCQILNSNPKQEFSVCENYPRYDNIKKGVVYTVINGNNFKCEKDNIYSSNFFKKLLAFEAIPKLKI